MTSNQCPKCLSEDKKQREVVRSGPLGVEYCNAPWHKEEEEKEGDDGTRTEEEGR